LARTGYQSQQTDEKESPDRPSNLWTPVHGDYAAHGSFDNRARKRSWQLWMTMHGSLIFGAFGALAGMWLLYPRRAKQKGQILSFKRKRSKAFRLAA
jgi:hypothetical protein